MTALVATPPTFSGLDKALEIQDFHKSCALYNELLDGDQPPVGDEHITNLAERFVRHNAEKLLVMLDSSIVKNTRPTRITGWKFESANGKPRVCTTKEAHAQMTSGNHKVFNAGKPIPKLENAGDLKEALISVGIL